MKALQLPAASVAMILCSIVLSAQTIPVNTKFGNVSQAEIEMTVYQPDTVATAVMLYEKNAVDILTSQDVSFTRMYTVYERIKVLKEEGKSYADFRIYYSGDIDDRESVTGIKVVTWNIENGKIRKSKLEKPYIFREKVTDNVMSVSFSAPDVRVGSVIEVSYEMRSDRFWEIDRIGLQRSIPINLIDASFSWPSLLEYNRVMRGRLQPIYRQETDQRILDPNARLVNAFLLYTDNYRNTDVPAIRKDRHCYCPEQFMNSVDYDLSRITILGLLTRSYAKTWEDVDKLFMESSIVKECKARNRKSDEYKALIAGIEDEKEVIATIRRAVMNDIKWNGKRGYYPESASKLYKDAVGSAASINALTAGILSGLGYQTDPVLIRLRSNGALLDFHVGMDSFDTFILRVLTPSGAVHYLDVAPDNCYIDVLDDEYLVEKARVLPSKGNGYWVDLRNLTRNQTLFMVSETVEADGTVTGKATCVAHNEESASLKRYRSHFDSEEAFAESLEEKGIEITSIEFTGESFTPSANLEYQYEKEATVSGDMMYIQPFIRDFHAEGDFRSPSRDIPVEFAYTEGLNYNYMLEIPEGYVIEELPRSLRVDGPGMNMMLMCRSSDASHINLKFSVTRTKTIYPENEYADLRAFWEQLCNVYKATIVLKRVS